MMKKNLITILLLIGLITLANSSSLRKNQIHLTHNENKEKINKETTQLWDNAKKSKDGLVNQKEFAASFRKFSKEMNLEKTPTSMIATSYSKIQKKNTQGLNKDEFEQFFITMAQNKHQDTKLVKKNEKVKKSQKIEKKFWTDTEDEAPPLCPYEDPNCEEYQDWVEEHRPECSGLFAGSDCTAVDKFDLKYAPRCDDGGYECTEFVEWDNENKPDCGLFVGSCTELDAYDRRFPPRCPEDNRYCDELDIWVEEKAPECSGLFQNTCTELDKWYLGFPHYCPGADAYNCEEYQTWRKEHPPICEDGSQDCDEYKAWEEQYAEKSESGWWVFGGKSKDGEDGETQEGQQQQYAEPEHVDGEADGEAAGEAEAFVAADGESSESEEESDGESGPSFWDSLNPFASKANNTESAAPAESEQPQQEGEQEQPQQEGEEEQHSFWDSLNPFKSSNDTESSNDTFLDVPAQLAEPLNITGGAQNTSLLKKSSKKTSTMSKQLRNQIREHAKKVFKAVDPNENHIIIKRAELIKKVKSDNSTNSTNIGNSILGGLKQGGQALVNGTKATGSTIGNAVGLGDGEDGEANGIDWQNVLHLNKNEKAKQLHVNVQKKTLKHEANQTKANETTNIGTQILGGLKAGGQAIVNGTQKTGSTLGNAVGLGDGEHDGENSIDWGNVLNLHKKEDTKKVHNNAKKHEANQTTNIGTQILGGLQAGGQAIVNGTQKTGSTLGNAVGLGDGESDGENGIDWGNVLNLNKQEKENVGTQILGGLKAGGQAIVNGTKATTSTIGNVVGIDGETNDGESSIDWQNVLNIQKKSNIKSLLQESFIELEFDKSHLNKQSSKAKNILSSKHQKLLKAPNTNNTNSTGVQQVGQVVKNGTESALNATKQGGEFLWEGTVNGTKWVGDKLPTINDGENYFDGEEYWFDGENLYYLNDGELPEFQSDIDWNKIWSNK